MSIITQTYITDFIERLVHTTNEGQMSTPWIRMSRDIWTNIEQSVKNTYAYTRIYEKEATQINPQNAMVLVFEWKK